jgi:hypothetical protein
MIASQWATFMPIQCFFDSVIFRVKLASEVANSYPAAQKNTRAERLPEQYINVRELFIAEASVSDQVTKMHRILWRSSFFTFFP